MDLLALDPGGGFGDVGGEGGVKCDAQPSGSGDWAGLQLRSKVGCAGLGEGHDSVVGLAGFEVLRHCSRDV